MGSGEAARLIRAITGKSTVTGTGVAAMIRALRHCGIHSAPQMVVGKPTLAEWLRRTHGGRGGKVFLLVAGNHWQLVSGARFVCGITKEVVALDHPKVKRRARVSEVYLLTAPNGVKIPAMARKPKARAPSAYAQAVRLAKRWGIRIEAEGPPRDRLYWVFGPDGVYDDDEDGGDGGDPCEGSHSCVGWDEVLDNVQTYVRDLQARAA